MPNVTFYDGDTKVTPDSNNTVFFHEKLTAVLSTTTYWPINVEMIYKTSKVGGKYVDYTNPVEYTAGGDLRVSARAILADGSSTSDSSNSVLYTIQQDASHVKKEVSAGSSTIKLFNPPTSSQPLTAESITGSAWKYNINVGAQLKVITPIKQKGLPFYKWKVTPNRAVEFDDPYSYLTYFTMPNTNFTLEAEYKAPEVITQNTNIIIDAGKPAGKSLTLSQAANGAFSVWRHLKYQWYEGDSASGTPLNNFDSFEIGKTYTARVTITVTEGCTFTDGAGVQTITSPSNGYISVDEDKLTRATDNKSIAFDLHLLTKPELTIELAPGDTLPTAADLTDQLPEGYTIKTLTWAGDATTALSSAGEMTITKLEIVPAEGSYQLANSSVWINGTERTGTYKDSTLTLTNITVPVKAKGVMVSGTAVSWNNTDNAEYLLYDGSTSDADIKAEWKVGTYKTALAYTPVKGGITLNADSKRYDQTFTFNTISEGNYKLVIFKPGKYVPKIVPITVGTTDYTCGQLKLWLYGDVNYDGAVKTIDITMARQYFKGNLTLTDEQIAVMDMNGDGTIKVIDITILRQYFKGNISEIPIT